MKPLLYLVAGLLPLMPCAAADVPAPARAPREWTELKVASGKVYKEVKLIKADDEALRVSHASGVARIPY